MIYKLYKYSKYGFPLISFVLLITCTIVTVATAFQNELYYIFSMQSRPFYFWQIFSGIFEHSIFPTWFIWPHFLGNMSVIIMFGVLIERLLGSNKMLLLTSLGAVSNILFFQIRFSGQFVSGSGASGIVYSYAPVALYIFYKYIKGAKYNYKKDYLLYLLALEYIFIWLFITAMSSWSGTNIYHVVATIVGILFLILFRKKINLEIDYVLFYKDKMQQTIKNKGLYLTLIAPLLIIVVLFLYKGGYLQEMFIQPISISSYNTIQDIVDNNNTIEINFEKPITEFKSIYTSGFDSSEISYSEDRKTIYCIFENGIHYPYEMKLCSAYSVNGQIVRDITINIK